MTKQRITIVSCISLLFLALLSVSFLYATHRTITAKAASPSCCGKWRVVKSPNPGTIHNGFNSVAAISAKDVWAVGSKGNQGSTQTLIEHWNGSTWSVVKSPNPSATANSLSGVAAISSSNVWAVGNSYDSHVSKYQTLVEHYNGSSWSVVSSPSPGSFLNNLSSVTAISANDVWAVGDSVSDSQHHTLIEHWNGTTWSIVNSPNQGTNTNVLFGITAISANDLWAVGQYVSSKALTLQTLIEHYNGSTWTIVTSPNIKAMDNGLGGVTAVSSHDIWAVGNASNLSSNTSQTLIEHYNGSTWTIIASPNASSQSFLHGVTVISANDVWAVGLSINSAGIQKTLIEQWNGSTWRMVSSPNPGSALNSLGSVTRVPKAGQIWAVGSYATNNNMTNTFAELYC
ncbi:MAG TPA: hypothetical protein VK667_09995 [Ktedonobacteraceae bacterium]|nr:hypothetical protein [Ktedonobacteraceae bacterium]